MALLRSLRSVTRPAVRRHSVPHEIPDLSTFLFVGRARTQLHTARLEQSPMGECSPANSHAGRPSRQPMLPQGAPGSHSQDTASGTSPTWPPASGSVVCTLYNTLPADLVSAPSIKRTSSSNPEGPLRSGAAGQHHPALWAFYTPTLETLGSLPLAPANGEPRVSGTGSLPLPWMPTADRVPGNPVTSGSRPDGHGECPQRDPKMNNK